MDIHAHNVHTYTMVRNDTYKNVKWKRYTHTIEEVHYTTLPSTYM